jgi:hypothetical protein
MWKPAATEGSECSKSCGDHMSLADRAMVRLNAEPKNAIEHATVI